MIRVSRPVIAPLWIIPCGALKIRRCSGLDLWVVPAWSLNTRRHSGLDMWIVVETRTRTDEEGYRFRSPYQSRRRRSRNHLSHLSLPKGAI